MLTDRVRVVAVLALVYLSRILFIEVTMMVITIQTIVIGSSRNVFVLVILIAFLAQRGTS